MYTRPNAPRSIGGVLDDGLKLWLESLSKTWPLALIAQLLYAVPLIMLRIQLKDLPIVPSSNALTAANAANAQLFLAIFKSPVLILTYLVTILIAVACYTAIVTRIEGVSKNSASSLQDSLAAGFRLLPRVLLQLLVFILCGIVIGIAVAILGGIAVAGFGSAKSSLLPIVSVVLMFVLLFFILGRIFLSFIALVVENAGAIASIKLSWTLTRGNWWRCSTILVVLVIIGIVFSLVIAFANGVTVVSLGATSVMATVLTQLVGAVANAFLGSLYPAVLISIFHDLKLRKQGVDLAGRVNALAPQ